MISIFGECKHLRRRGKESLHALVQLIDVFFVLIVATILVTDLRENEKYGKLFI